MNQRTVVGVPNGPDRGLTMNVHNFWKGLKNRENRMVVIGPHAMFETAPKNYRYVVTAAYNFITELNNSWEKHYRILYPFGKMAERSELNIEYRMDSLMAQPTVLGNGIHNAVTMWSESTWNNVEDFSAGIQLPYNFQDTPEGDECFNGVVAALRQSTWNRMEALLWNTFHFIIPWHIQWMTTFDRSTFVDRAMDFLRVTQNRLRLNSVTEGSLAFLDKWIDKLETEDGAAPNGMGTTNFWVVGESTATGIKFDIKRNFEAVTGIWPRDDKGEVNLAFVPGDIRSVQGKPAAVQSSIKDERGKPYPPTENLYNHGGHFVTRNATSNTTTYMCNTSGDIKTLKGSINDMDTLTFRNGFRHAYGVLNEADRKDGKKRVAQVFGSRFLGEAKFLVEQKESKEVQNTAVPRLAEWLRFSSNPPVSEQAERDVYRDNSSKYNNLIMPFLSFLRSNATLINNSTTNSDGFYQIGSADSNLFLEDKDYLAKRATGHKMALVLEGYIKNILSWMENIGEMTLVSSSGLQCTLKKKNDWGYFVIMLNELLKGQKLYFTEVSKELMDAAADPKTSAIPKTPATAWFLTALRWDESMNVLGGSHVRQAEVGLNFETHRMESILKNSAFNDVKGSRFLSLINIMYLLFVPNEDNLNGLVDNGIPLPVRMLYVRPNQTFNVDNAIRTEPGAYEFVMQDGQLEEGTKSGSSGEFVNTIWREALCVKTVRPKKRFVVKGLTWLGYRFGMENTLMSYRDMMGYKKTADITVQEMKDSNDTMVFFVGPLNDVHKRIILTSDDAWKNYWFDEWFVRNIYSDMLRDKFDIGVDPLEGTNKPPRSGYLSYVSQWVRDGHPNAKILRNYTSYPDAYQAPILSHDKNAYEKIIGYGHFPEVAKGCLNGYLANGNNPTLQITLGK